MRTILVGRHKLSGKEGLEVVAQKNINFPAKADDCRQILVDLLKDAISLEASLVFQMMPGQLAVSCAAIVGEDTKYHIGVIINVPGERPSGVTKSFGSDDPYAPGAMEELAKFCNPRAKVEVDEGEVTVTVDPPLRFEFSHIEWF